MFQRSHNQLLNQLLQEGAKLQRQDLSFYVSPVYDHS